jgi:hypothetical protein
MDNERGRERVRERNRRISSYMAGCGYTYIPFQSTL